MNSRANSDCLRPAMSRPCVCACRLRTCRAMREREKGKLKLTEAASRTFEAAPASSLPSPAVLVVDDDAIVAESIAQYLAGIGYASQWTHSAEEALDRITRDG